MQIKRKTISFIIALSMALSLVSLNIANTEGYAAEADAEYDTFIELGRTYITEMQDDIDEALKDCSPEEGKRAGRVCIKLKIKYFTSPIEDCDLSIPTDKGIDSVTFVNASSHAMVVVGCQDHSFNVFANGIPIIIDKGVCIGFEYGIYYSPEQKYRVVDVTVYGGSRDKDVDSTSVTVKDGGVIMGTLYGGGLNGDVKGDVNINVEGACGKIYGGGYVRYVKIGKNPLTIASDTADVGGAVNINVRSEKQHTQETPYGLLGSRYGSCLYDGGVYGGGHIRVEPPAELAEPTEKYTFSAQVKNGVTINVNCQAASDKIFGGGDIQPAEDPLNADFNADVTGNVSITIGENVKVADYYYEVNSGYKYSIMVFGGGIAESKAFEGADTTASAQIHGNVTINAENFAAAVTDDNDGCDSIFGGGYASGEHANANVNGDTYVTTSRKAPAFKSQENRFVSAGVAGGGYASSGGTANVTGNAAVHICRAENQSDTYANVKNVFGGGVSTGGYANIGGESEVIIDENVSFEGGLFENEKTGVIGGGWANSAGSHADVSGAASITVGKGAAFGSSCRIISGGKVGTVSENYADSTANVGDINVTLSGTTNKVEEFYLGSFEGRSPADSSTVTLKDSGVDYLYDMDIKNKSNESIITTTYALNMIGNSELGSADLRGWHYPKTYLLNIGDGSTPTTAKIDYYLYGVYGNQPTYGQMNINILDNADLQAQDSGSQMFYNLTNLTSSQSGKLGILSDETVWGELSGNGTVTMPAGKKVTVTPGDNGVGAFSGNIVLSITGEPKVGDVVATTLKSKTTGTFTYDGDNFIIKKVENGDNYDWVLAQPYAVVTPPTAKQLTYTGVEQVLVDVGSAEGGTIVYSLDGENYSADILPKGTNAGKYTVYYKAVGDESHSDTEPQTIEVTIAKADGEAAVSMADYNCGDASVSPVPVSATNGTDNVTYLYKATELGDETYSSDKPTVAGEYTVKAVFAETDNYNSLAAYGTFTISHTETADPAKPAKAPTCTETGLTEGKICSGCGEVIAEQTVIPATDHSYSDNWSSDAENHWHECSVCGEKKDKEEHSWDDGKITTEPTLTDKGVKTYTCTVCERTKTEEIPVIIPTPSPSASTEPLPSTSDKPTPSESAEPTPSASAEPTPSASAEPTPSASVEPSPSASAESSPSASAEPTPTASAEPTPSASAEPTPSASAEPTPSASAEPSPSASAEPTPSASAEPTPSASAEPSASASAEPTPTASAEPSPSVSSRPHTSGGGGSVSYTVTFNAGDNGKIAEGSNNVKVTRGQEINPSSLPTVIANDGYKFVGWSIDGKTVIDIDDTVINSAVTLTAVYEDIVPEPTAGPDVSGLLETTKHIKYINGYFDGTVRPDGNITRAETAQMFYNLLIDKSAKTSSEFIDVDAAEWYAEAVNTLASMGIISGYDDGAFRPDANITRAEFVAMAERFTKSDAAASGDIVFSDVGTNDWYYNSVLKGAEYGWIHGYPSGEFKPNESITRAEAVIVVNNMLGRSADVDYVNANRDKLESFSDLKDDTWYYYDMTEAINAHNYKKTDNKEVWK